VAKLDQASAPVSNILTDLAGKNAVEIATAAPSAGAAGLVVYPASSAGVTMTEDAADGTVGATAPTTAILIGVTDANGKIQPLGMDAVSALKVSNIGVGLNSYGQVGISAAAVIKAANANRAALLVKNAGSAIVYLGDASVTTGTGYPLFPGEAVGLPTKSAVYGVAASGTQTIGYLEFV
jgi:hypothetical protein